MYIYYKFIQHVHDYIYLEILRKELIICKHWVRGISLHILYHSSIILYEWTDEIEPMRKRLTQIVDKYWVSRQYGDLWRILRW